MTKPVFRVSWLYSHRKWLEPRDFVFMKQRDCTIYVVKINALLKCAFVFTYIMQKAGFLMMRLKSKNESTLATDHAD